MLGKQQLEQSMVKEAIASFIKANDATEYMAVIAACDTSGTFAHGYGYIMWWFQYAFAAAAATIVSGAVAERCEVRAPPPPSRARAPPRAR